MSDAQLPAISVDLIPASGRLKLTVILRAIDPTSTLEAAEEILGIFCSAVSLGICGCGPRGDVLPRCTLGDVVRRPGTFTAEMDLEGIDRSAERMLLNMIVQTHFENEPLASVSLAADPASMRDVGAKTVIALPFASRPPSTPFQIVSGQHEGSDLILRITTAKAMSRGDVELIEQAINDWDSVVLMGGFFKDLRESENPMWPGDTRRIGEKVIEHYVTAYVAGEKALDGFLHMMIGVGLKGLTLSAVEIA